MIAYTPNDMRYADKYAVERLNIHGTVLMDRAADALFDALKAHIGKQKNFAILCGKGNNGGDGWALAVKLLNISENVVCVSVSDKPTSADALYFYDKCLERIGYSSLNITDASVDFFSCAEAIKQADVIVDGIFGTGFSGEILKDGVIAKTIELANENKKAFKLAIDIPSGADALYGKVSQTVFRADLTVSFAKPKIGMFSYPAKEFCGKIKIADIGIPNEVFESFDSKYEIADNDAVKKYLPFRAANSNKGTFGKVLIYAGSENMPGAAQLAVSGALRCGAGLVCLASDNSVTDIIKSKFAEPIYFPISDSDNDTDRLIEYSRSCSAILIGCGLGKDKKTTERIKRLICECDLPIILDADGINAISDNINILSEAKNKIILTPHPLEFSRISKLDVSDILNSRIECADEFAKKYNCILLLKGAGTVISDGGKRICINPVACSALAKGGSGDVLSGMIASFASQGAGLYESAVIAAYLHGVAGIELSRTFSEYGVIPSEIPEKAARIIARLF